MIYKEKSGIMKDRQMVEEHENGILHFVSSAFGGVVKVLSKNSWVVSTE